MPFAGGKTSDHGRPGQAGAALKNDAKTDRERKKPVFRPGGLDFNRFKSILF
jgi:hypothetical protein